VIGSLRVTAYEGSALLAAERHAVRTRRGGESMPEAQRALGLLAMAWFLRLAVDRAPAGQRSCQA
jgi:hypothetical protein